MKKFITHIARAHIIPPYFALVHPNTETPINVTFLIIMSGMPNGFYQGF